jgi:hypothetical protein
MPENLLLKTTTKEWASKKDGLEITKVHDGRGSIMEEMALATFFFSAYVNWTREAWIMSELMRKNGKQWSMLRMLRVRMVRMVQI